MVPPGATETCGGLKNRSPISTLAVRGADDAACGAGGGAPPVALPVMMNVPFMAAGWTSQWKPIVPGFRRTMLVFVPAKRPPSAPGVTTPLSKLPSSAVSVCGFPPTLANTIVEPTSTVSVAGSNRRVSPARAGVQRLDAVDA